MALLLHRAVAAYSYISARKSLAITGLRRRRNFRRLFCRTLLQTPLHDYLNGVPRTICDPFELTSTSVYLRDEASAGKSRAHDFNQSNFRDNGQRNERQLTPVPPSVRETLGTNPIEDTLEIRRETA